MLARLARLWIPHCFTPLSMAARKPSRICSSSSCATIWCVAFGVLRGVPAEVRAGGWRGSARGAAETWVPPRGEASPLQDVEAVRKGYRTQSIRRRLTKKSTPTKTGVGNIGFVRGVPPLAWSTVPRPDKIGENSRNGN